MRRPLNSRFCVFRDFYHVISMTKDLFAKFIKLLIIMIRTGELYVFVYCGEVQYFYYLVGTKLEVDWETQKIYIIVLSY